MRGVRDEAAEALLRRGALREGGLDLAEHGVQREAEAADLGSRRRGLDAPAEVARRDRVRDSSHPAERPQPDLDDQQRQHNGAADNRSADEQLLEEELAERGQDVVDRNGEDDEVAIEGVLRPIDHPELGNTVCAGDVERLAGFVHTRVGEGVRQDGQRRLSG